ncbi:MAG TPA: metal-sulfur cluster assembly factor [Terriglobales bacterium]|nr:metal-sulfur cluster assembly factor [Terriglobales bacterium]
MSQVETVLSEETIRESLKSVFDPEIPVNIVDLGLVYAIRIKPAMQVASELAPAPVSPLHDIEVDMTLTSPGCPSHVTIGESVKQTIEALPGVQKASVDFIWTPAWGPERISAEGRALLGIEA